MIAQKSRLRNFYTYTFAARLISFIVNHFSRGIVVHIEAPIVVKGFQS